MSAAVENVDVIIVGSGPVGSTFARIIRDGAPTARILHLEAGPIVADPPGRHVKTIRDPERLSAAQVASQGPDRYVYPQVSPAQRRDPDTSLLARPGTFLLGPRSHIDGEDGLPAAAMSSNVGGMGSHWTCACPPPAFDERIPFIDADEFDALFAEASTLLHVSQSAFDDAPLGAEVRAALGSAVDDGRRPDRRVQPMPLGITVNDDGERYWTGTDVILGDLLTSSDGYELRPGSLVTRILQTDDATTTPSSRVVGVRIHDAGDGREYDVHAPVVVVAADSLRTPQLLHASGIRPQALGHYLNEHPQVIGVVQLDDRFIPAERRIRNTPGTVAAQSGVSWIPYHAELFPFHGQIMQMDSSPVPLDAVAEPWPGSIVGIGFFCPKEIQFSDRLEFSDTESDFTGLPAMTVHYRLTDKDRRTLTLAAEEITRIGEAIGTFVGSAPFVMPPGSSMHYMGTFRMGEHDDGASVCDPNSRVWGVAGLHLGGNGVIPTATAGNPTATSVALAIKAARAIVAELVANPGGDL